MKKRNILQFSVVVCLSVMLLITGCDTFSWNRVWSESQIEEIIIPEIEVSGGGVQSSPPPSANGVYYYNDSHSSSESDIRLDDVIRHEQTVRRYMRVSGTAIPDDSGLHLVDETDDRRWYHAVFFMIENKGTSERDYFSIPVDDNNVFDGYLYFKDTGKYAVFAFRNKDYLIYERGRGTDVTVSEGSSTLYFYANVKEAVPADVAHLIPTRNVDCGVVAIRDMARLITADCTTDLAKARRVYEFLTNHDPTSDIDFVDLNSSGGYASIFPTITDSYNDAFLASHFLERRKGVCNDFAELYAAMMRSLGFKVKKEMGWISPGGVGHMWNRLDLTGDTPEDDWLKIDPLWGVDIGMGNIHQWAELYPGFDEDFFDNAGGLPHSSFSYDHRIEY
jgi:hypothetical protein